ncbi:hypothetical protein IFO70_17615 [Phormidium tenue FACHB-886]|nr:hypothetical protein [Phormidium tenue FACHB-886]
MTRLTHKFPSPFVFQKSEAVLATMHRKEEAIAPFLAQVGLHLIVPEGFDTDRFGTFTREIPRSGSQLEAARQKAEQAMALTGHSIAVASEGAFLPHPAMPYLPCNRELVVLIDRDYGLELVGEALSLETNFNHCTIRSFADAQAFAQKVGFPQHGLVVIAQGNSNPITKGITTAAQLQAAVSEALAVAPTAHLETDMRAMHNPTRMKVIAQATQNLIQTIRQVCPDCGCPGFAIGSRQPGLPCGLCRLPTPLVRLVVYQCQHCGFSQETAFPDSVQYADPAQCSYCNP